MPNPWWPWKTMPVRQNIYAIMHAYACLHVGVLKLFRVSVLEWTTGAWSEVSPYLLCMHHSGQLLFNLLWWPRKWVFITLLLIFTTTYLTAVEPPLSISLWEFELPYIFWHCCFGIWRDIQPVKILHQQSSSEFSLLTVTKQADETKTKTCERISVIFVNRCCCT